MTMATGGLCDQGPVAPKDIFLSHCVVSIKVKSAVPLAESRSEADISHILLISLSRPWACRWINHWNLWRMASVTPDLRLFSQPQGITTSWLVPNHTAWWRGTRVWTTYPRLLPESARLGFELVTFGVASPVPYDTRPPNMVCTL